MQELNLKAIPADALNILTVDDEIFNLEILSEWLTQWGARVETAENGKQALHKLESAQNQYDVILLDRMMPEMDGFEFLTAISQYPQWKDIPVIMQSASATVDEIEYALTSGIWYYLSKPFNRAKLYSVIETAVLDTTVHLKLREQVKNTRPASEHDFQIQNLHQAYELALSLATLAAAPEKVVTGLYELLVNAVEHGNLEISYREKTRLLSQNVWLEEINNRLNCAPYSDRFVNVKVSNECDRVHYLIKDQGKGFKCNQYLSLQPHRAADTHGRGVAYAKQQCFVQLEYLGDGNEVLAVAAA